jgi:YebC/PmpR family DNA-binding regulatory protein
MAKHSHWDNIKHHKAVNDAKKAAVIAKMGKLITVAVSMGGPNPDDNPRLRLALAKARSAKMNNEAIERAIKKAAGEGGAGKLMETLSYEGYAPGGVAVVVESLTDNRHRTAPEIKKLFERAGGAIGAPGCVAWQFKPKAAFLVEGIGEDAALEALLAADAEPDEIHSEGEGRVSILAEPYRFDAVARGLAAGKAVVVDAGLTRLPDNRVAVDPAHVEAVRALLDALEEHDDVQDVYHNGEFPG